MSAERLCPMCGAAMEARPSFGIEIDVCPQCGGVFLDPGEAEAQGVDTGALFGAGPGAATELGPSIRRCPAHREPMIRYRIPGQREHVDIERAACCGGVFLDPGEQGDLAAAAAHASRLAARGRAAPAWAPPPRPAPRSAPSEGEIRTATGAVFAAPPPPEPGGALGAVVRNVVRARPVAREVAASAEAGAELAPSEPTERACPRCGEAYVADRAGGVEIDVCPGCGSMFFDVGEIDARADTAALFGVGAEASTPGGPSPLACPACAVPMEMVRIATLAGPLEVERATCCGGLFLDGGEEDAFARAARAASFAAADQQYARDGAVVGEAAMTKAMGAPGALSAATAAFVRSRVDSMIVHMMRRRRRAGALRYHDDG